MPKIEFLKHICDPNWWIKCISVECKKGWTLVFERSYRKFIGRLKGMGASEEDASEAFYESLEALSEFTSRKEFDHSRIPNEKVEAYLWTMVRRKYIQMVTSSESKNGLSKANIQNPLSLDQLLEDHGWEVEAEEAMDWQADFELVKQALNQMPEERRKIILLRYFGDLDHKGLAEVMGFSESENDQKGNNRSRTLFKRSMDELRKRLAASFSEFSNVARFLTL